MSRLLLDWAPPSPRRDLDDPFGALLDYTEARLDYFSNDRTRRLLNAVRKRRERGAIIACGLMSKRACFHTVVELVAAAGEAGLLRIEDPEAAAYLISAGAAHEAIMTGDLFDFGAVVDKGGILLKLFANFVTPRGTECLNAFIAARPQRTQTVERRLPLGLHDRADDETNACPMFVRRTLISLGVASPSIHIQ